MKDFVHLHVHSEYSLLDGAARIVDLVDQAAALGQRALAITDHGCMYGAIAFYKACKAAGVKAIIGMEAYVSPRKLEEKDGKMDREYAHFILLAKNAVGYKNLCYLSSLAFTKGYYYRPRIDYETLADRREGLIAMSACLSGDLPRLLMDGMTAEAEAYVQRMQAIFGEDFYVELQDHGIPEERQILPELIRIGRKYGAKLACTNDVHYVLREDAEAQDALLCIQTQRYLDDADRMRMTGEEFYLKSADEMEALFAHCPESLDTTVEIADKCELEFDFDTLHLPNYDVPEGETHEGYLRKLCEKGLAEKCEGKGEDYRDRLDFELKMIAQMGYTDYFLIVWDFIDYARSRGIMVGPGRGSAAGSIAAYCLNITNVDPIAYGLIFERFLNPERISMPDIDIDFCYERRQEVIDYVVEKYGEDHVAQIITFGTMGAKQAVRDVGRVMQVPYGDVDKLAKMIPFDLSMTLEKALTISIELRTAYESDATARKIIDLALKVEGLPRHASTHAAGVVIAAKPLVEYLPLQTNDGAVTTQFPMGTIEELGLLKMDFLGLRTLTVIRDALAEMKRVNPSLDVDMDGLDFNDRAVYDMLSRGDTDGVFQLESGGMRSFLQQLKPDRFEEIIAGISLYRPGPMDQIPAFVDRKFHPEHIRYTHPMLEGILKTTYGCIVYQEQVMQIVRDLAGYSWGRSDLVRRAMSKKKKDVMIKEQSAFIEGCAAHGVQESVARAIFDQMLDFAQYAFNKSHAAAYAVVAYQTGWLKVHYPEEFFAALLNSFLSDNRHIAAYLHACRMQGIPLLPPDVNHSAARFSVEWIEDENGARKKAVRFGLGGVKHLGFAACEAIATEREHNGPFADFRDFLERCMSVLNKRMVECMIQVGAMDGFGHKRSSLCAVHTAAMDRIAAELAEKRNGQFSLFDAIAGDESARIQIAIPDLEEFSRAQMLAMEKDATGLYVSGHPLQEFDAELARLKSSRDVLSAGEEGEMRDETRVSVGGIVAGVRMTLTKKNDQMAYLQLEDMMGQFECVVFPRVLERYRHLLRNDQLIVVTGRINTKDEDDNVLLAEEIAPLEHGTQPTSGAPSQSGPSGGAAKQRDWPLPGLYVRCAPDAIDEIVVLLQDRPGDTTVFFAIDGKKRRDDRLEGCHATGKLMREMKQRYGEENVRLIF